MVGFSSGRPRTASGDEVPLNKSFDTQATSDTYCSATDASALSNTNVASVWGLSLQNQRANHVPSSELHPRRTSFSSAETEKVRNTARTAVPTRSWRNDLTTRYSPSLGIMFESADGQEEIFHDEPQPRTLKLPPLHITNMLPDEEALNEERQDPEFYDNMIMMRSDLNQRWQEGPPQTLFAEAAERPVENIFIDSPNIGIPDDDAAESIDEARSRARAALEKASKNEHTPCNEIIWTAWGCNDRKRRNRVVCCMIGFLLVVATIGFFVGLLGRRSRNMEIANARETAGSNNDGFKMIGNLPGKHQAPTQIATQTDTAPSSPTLLPSATPQPKTSQPTFHQKPLTKRPVVGTVPPDLPLPTRQMHITPSPTGRLTVQPASSTQSPSQCQSTLSVDKDCYVEATDLIVVGFTNCDPQNDDWVGIWLNSENPKNLTQDFYTWAWSCGTRSCRGAPRTMRMAFETNGMGIHNFRAFLVSDSPNGQTYVALAMSHPFVVTNNCTV